MGLRKRKLSLIILRKTTANQHAALRSTSLISTSFIVKLGSLENPAFPMPLFGGLFSKKDGAEGEDDEDQEHDAYTYEWDFDQSGDWLPCTAGSLHCTAGSLHCWFTAALLVHCSTGSLQSLCVVNHTLCTTHVMTSRFSPLGPSQMPRAISSLAEERCRDHIQLGV